MAHAERKDDGLGGRLGAWAQRHVQECLGALGRLARRPVSTLLTSLAIGITLALPLGMRVVLQNLDAANYAWERSFSLTAFVDTRLDDASGARLADTLGQRPEVLEHRYISRDEAMAEFRALSGFDAALDLLDDNPLPAVIVLSLRTDLQTPAVRALAADLGNREDIDRVQLDTEWLERLQALTAAGHRAVTLLAALLAVAVIITVGNTIRLDVQNRSHEIVVMKLVGATDAFVQRPFLYAGVWYGLLGGGLALLCLSVSLGFLAGPVQQLAGLYDSKFQLSGVSFGDAVTVLIIGPLLGLFGSMLAVAVHVVAIEPE